MARKKSLESFIALNKKSIPKVPKLKTPKKGGYKPVKLGKFKMFKFK